MIHKLAKIIRKVLALVGHNGVQKKIWEISWEPRSYYGCSLGNISGVDQRDVEKVVQGRIGDERRKEWHSFCEAKGEAM
jgi:hypothetical protein